VDENPRLADSSLPRFSCRGVPSLLREVPVLQLENTDRGEKAPDPHGTSASFSFSFSHSCYLEPATEEFEGGKGEAFISGECEPEPGRGRLLRV